MKKYFILILLCFGNNICEAQWMKLNNDTLYYYSAITFLNKDTGFVAGFDWYNSGYAGVIIRTMDGGNTWDTTKIDPGPWFMSIQFLNDTLGYACGQDGFIYKTTDMGNNWQYVNPCQLTDDISNLYFTNQDTGFYQKFNGNLMMTDAGGGPCYDIGLTDLYSYFPGTGALRFLDSNNGYIAGGYGKFSRTIDRGITWQSFNNDSSILVLSAWMRNVNHGVLVGRNGMVSVTQNGGVNWSQPISISPHPILDVMLKDSLLGYAVGGADLFYYGPYNLAPRGLIWKTVDGGYSWSVEDSSWNDQLTAITIINDSLAFAVGYRGLVLRKSTSLFAGVNVNNFSTSKISIYPNPFSNELHLEIQNNKNIQFTMYDILSRKVFQNTYNNSVILETDKIANGIYLYELSKENRIIKTGKLIKNNQN